MTAKHRLCDKSIFEIMNLSIFKYTTQIIRQRSKVSKLHRL